jgi:hypothetical protein
LAGKTKINRVGFHRCFDLLGVREHRGIAGGCGGEHLTGERIFLAPFPVNGGLRPDTGRPVDMSNWMIGPRRTYHLKVEKSSQ